MTLVAFVGGWLIFLSWAGGRYFVALDFTKLEFMGFFWMIAFFFLALLGLLLLAIYVVINRKNLHLKMLFTALMILINIPSVLLIIRLHGNIEKKVFVKFTNQSELEDINIELRGNVKNFIVGKIHNGDSKIFSYEPPYSIIDSRIYQEADSLNLIIRSERIVDTIGFPKLRNGDCNHFIIGKDRMIRDQ
jgi:hypothetical protein